MGNIDNLDMILNDCLNKAMCRPKRIKNPNSNNIAEFVANYINENRLCAMAKIQNEDSVSHLEESNLQVLDSSDAQDFARYCIDEYKGLVSGDEQSSSNCNIPLVVCSACGQSLPEENYKHIITLKID